MLFCGLDRDIGRFFSFQNAGCRFCRLDTVFPAVGQNPADDARIARCFLQREDRMLSGPDDIGIKYSVGDKGFRLSAAPVLQKDKGILRQL